MNKQLFFLFLFLAHFGFGQALPPVRNFSPKDYQAGNQNWMISQAENRKMYFANNNGLLEFNGEHWYTYPMSDQSIVRSVHWHDGLLYTGSFMDFGFWETQQDGTLTYTSLTKELNVTINEDEQFWNIISNNSGVLFQSLDRVYFYDPVKKIVRQILEKDRLTKIFEVDNRIFFNLSEVGLFEFNAGDLILIESAVALNGDVIQMNHSGSTITLVTSSNDLFELNDNTVSLKSKNQYSKPITVYSATRLKQGNYALGTISNGLLIIDKQGAIIYQLDQERGLSNNTVLSVYEDVDNNLWLGLDNGIDFIDLQSPFKNFIDRTGKLGTVYAALSNADELYLGTNQGVYYKAAGVDTFEFVAGTTGQVWMLKNIDGTIFCGHNLGTFILQGNSATKIDGAEGTWDIQTINGDPDRLIQGKYDGFNILERKDSKWTFKYKIEGFSISAKDFALVDNQIYISHEHRGLYKLTLDSLYSKITNSKLIENVGRGMNSDVIELGKDVLHANDQGIYIKSHESDQFVRNDYLSSLTEENGYTSGRMVKVNENTFWLFTEKSLIQVAVEPINNSFETKRILIPQDKRSETQGYESLIQLDGENYLMGTSQGYLLMDGNKLPKSQNQIAIDRIVVNKGRDTKNLLDINVDNDISNDVTSIQFYFYTTEYNAFSDVNYQYKLLGAEKEWSKPFKENTLLFENLDHGAYQLEIRAIINGTVSENIAKANFKIEPPFYLSKIAWILYLMLFIALIFALSFLFRWYYSRQRDYEVEKQKQKMEFDLLQSQKDVADLKNQQLHSDIDSRNRELAVTTMAMIKKNETLNQLKGELENLPKTTESKSLKKMLDKSLNSKQDWLTFEEAFNNADKDFFKKIKVMHPTLTSGDLRLCVYLRLNLSSKEVAPLLNISPRSVEIKRYRLRKKLGLSREDSLTSYIVEI